MPRGSPGVCVAACTNAGSSLTWTQIGSSRMPQSTALFLTAARMSLDAMACTSTFL